MNSRPEIFTHNDEVSGIANLGEVRLEVVVEGGLRADAVVVADICRNTTHYGVGVHLFGRCVYSAE